jgi:hypothetical protein
MTMIGRRRVAKTVNAGQFDVEQNQIARLVVEHAQSGRRVGGDFDLMLRALERALQKGARLFVVVDDEQREIFCSLGGRNRHAFVRDAPNPGVSRRTVEGRTETVAAAERANRKLSGEAHSSRRRLPQP